MTITPIADNEPFSMTLVHEAADLAHHDPARLTDLHLRHWATLDPSGAVAAQKKRDKATATRTQALKTQAIPAPVARPAGPPVAHLPSLDDADDFSTDEGLDDWTQRNAERAVPVAIWRGFVKTARVKREQLEARVAALEGRLADVESKRPPAYMGVHKNGVMYASSVLVTRGGGLWLSTEQTAETPGAGATAWRLVVKSGHAEDARR
ncbi:MAG TPA: hypothetical protein VNJ04_05445 [Gemmatimonadaceae bacterium]|nr:hypothetical protein [Gemmatimonadaceae bacterium]